MVISEQLEKSVDMLIKEIKSSKEYISFEEKLQNAKRDPLIMKKIERTREIREELSKMNEYDRNNDYAESLESEYDNLCDTTAIHEFSLAELEFCNLYQEVMSKIVDSFELNIQNRW